jgi:hypothetical protein
LSALVGPSLKTLGDSWRPSITLEDLEEPWRTLENLEEPWKSLDFPIF